MGTSDPSNLQKRLNILKFRWKNACNQYISAYPDYAINPQNNTRLPRAYQTVVKTLQDMRLFNAKINGTVSALNNYLEPQSTNIRNLKNLYNSSKSRLTSELGSNNASPTLKKDKYNANSESYIFTSYYIIALLSITYFIYKQNNTYFTTILITLSIALIVCNVYYWRYVFNK